MPVAGGEARQLTHSSKESTYSVSYFPKDSRILYTHDQGGNENNHLYVLEPGGKERDLTPGEKVKASFHGWSRDDKAFYYSTNERDLKFFDLYKMEIDGFKRMVLYHNATGYELGPISTDEKWIALLKPNTTSDSNIYVYNVASKQTKHVTPHTGDVSNQPADFDRESKSLYYLTNEGSEFAYIARHDLATGKRKPVEKAKWDIMYTYFSYNGKYRVTGINEDARTHIRIYEQATGKEVPLPRLPGDGDIRSVNISKSEKLMAFYFNGDRSPSDLFVYDFDARRTERLTHSLNPEIDPEHLVEGQVVRYR